MSVWNCKPKTNAIALILSGKPTGAKERSRKHAFVSKQTMNEKMIDVHGNHHKFEEEGKLA